MPAGYLNGSLIGERKAMWKTRLTAVGPESDHASCLLVVAEGAAVAALFAACHTGRAPHCDRLWRRRNLRAGAADTAGTSVPAATARSSWIRPRA